jgi:hypothetical protein
LHAGAGFALGACAPVRAPENEHGSSHMELKPLGTLTITMGKTIALPTTPVGRRMIIDFADVTLDGPRFKAKKAAVAAADWLVIGPEDTATLDIKFVLETADGANILVEGKGRTDSSRFAQGGPLYFAPLFETSDARYTWLNRVQGIARGRANGNVVTFELFEAA